jgi:hypothetical protein
MNPQKKARRKATENMFRKYKEKIASYENNSATNANLQEIWSLVDSNMSTMESKIL